MKRENYRSINLIWLLVWLNSCGGSPAFQPLAVHLKLAPVSHYSGQDAWKNRVLVGLNFHKKDSVGGYVQPFDYYELPLHASKLQWKGDSLLGDLPFSLPDSTGSYSFSVAAKRQKDSIWGEFVRLDSPGIKGSGTMANPKISLA